ncbi:MAG: hypothetical protein LBO09_06925 [Candidatus Peribacteria bacterium]|jgi:hypothetical protein|nr:hypothetical protein [Candidatus Peribacteria bacterium]
MDTISQINPPIKEATMLIDAWKTVENDKDLNKKRTKFLKNDGIRDAYRKMFG